MGGRGPAPTTRDAVSCSRGPAAAAAPPASACPPPPTTTTTNTHIVKARRTCSTIMNRDPLYKCTPARVPEDAGRACWPGRTRHPRLHGEDPRGWGLFVAHGRDGWVGIWEGWGKSTHKGGEGVVQQLAATQGRVALPAQQHPHAVARHLPPPREPPRVPPPPGPVRFHDSRQDGGGSAAVVTAPLSQPSQGAGRLNLGA